MNAADWSTLGANLAPAVVVNGVLAAAAYRLGGVRRSGVYGGLAVGIPIYLFLGWRGFVVLAAMYGAGTFLTRLGYERKERLGTAEAQRGARGASHALANVGVAALCAAAAWWNGSELWRVAFTAALATAAMDTAGSEVGPLWGGATLSLRSFRKVSPGSPGAVSVGGTAAGLAVAFLLGLVAWATQVTAARALAPIVLGAAAGNLYEGILGSRRLLPHGWLNATNTAVGAGVAVVLAAVWKG